MIRAVLLVLAIALCAPACEHKPEPTTDPEPQGSSTEDTRSAAPPATPDVVAPPPPAGDNVTRYTRKSYTFDIQGPWFTTAPEQDEASDALTLSGPPGGPQLITVEPLNAEGLEAHVRAAHREPLEVGSPGYVGFAADHRHALVAVTGESLARTAFCTIAVPGKDGDLAVSFGIGWQEPDRPSCDAILAIPVLKDAARAFRLR